MMIRDVVDEINDENEFFFPKLIDFSQLQIQGVFDFLLSLSLFRFNCVHHQFSLPKISFTPDTHTDTERENLIKDCLADIYIFCQGENFKISDFFFLFRNTVHVRDWKKRIFFRFSLGKMIIFLTPINFLFREQNTIIIIKIIIIIEENRFFQSPKKLYIILAIGSLFVHSFIFSIFIGFCSR